MTKKLSSIEIAELLWDVEDKYFSKGFAIGSESRFFNKVYFLKRGAVKIMGLSKNGEEIVKYIIEEGDFFGILALFQLANKNDSAVFIQDSVIKIMDPKLFIKRMGANPMLNSHIFKLVGLRIKMLEFKLESLMQLDAKSRIKDFIIDYIIRFGKEFDDRWEAQNLLSNEEIGKLTATSRQTVNRILNNLKRKETIDFDKDTISIAHSTLIMEREN